MANQIVIAGGQVGSTNWINTEVADNEYPVMGSGIKAAIDAAGGGGLNAMVITFAWGDGDSGTPDKTWEEVVAAYEAGTTHFIVQDDATCYGIAIMTLSGDDPFDLVWTYTTMSDNQDGTAEINTTYIEFSENGFSPSYTSVTVATS
jgi:hypothetical protein